MCVLFMDVPVCFHLCNHQLELYVKNNCIECATSVLMVNCIENRIGEPNSNSLMLLRYHKSALNPISLLWLNSRVVGVL